MQTQGCGWGGGEREGFPRPVTLSHKGSQARAEQEKHSKQTGRQKQGQGVREPSVAGRTQVSRGGYVGQRAGDGWRQTS